MTVTDDTIRPGRECIPGPPKPDGSENSFCQLCHAIMQPRLSAVVSHEKTKKHQQKVRAAASTLPLPVVRTQRVAENVRHAELQLAIFTACHMSFQAVDHLGEVITHNGEGSPLGRIKLHRTKCSKLVTEVVAPALKEELREDIKGKKFAVLIDESTDVASHKLLCVVLRYFSEREGQILTEFLDLLQVVEATGEVLFNALKESLTNIGLSLVDCIGFGCDGASSMVRKHNSVWSHIKQESPNCLLVSCICHSLALSNMLVTSYLLILGIF